MLHKNIKSIRNVHLYMCMFSGDPGFLLLCKTTSQTMATSSDSDVAGVIEFFLGLASSTKCSNPPAAESRPLTKPMKEVILEGDAKEINSARGSTENPYGMKNKILQKWQTNFSWLTGTC